MRAGVAGVVAEWWIVLNSAYSPSIISLFIYFPNPVQIGSVLAGVKQAWVLHSRPEEEYFGVIRSQLIER